MSECWTSQEHNFYGQGNFQGQLSYYNENNQKLSKKTYLNPQVVNYEFIRRSLSKSCLQGTSKIHVNPNFKGSKLSTTTNKNYPHLINILNSKSHNTFLCEPGTSNTSSVREEKSCVNLHVFDQGKNSNNTTVIPYQSRFKKVNISSLKKNNTSYYSWCRNITNKVDVDSCSKISTGLPAVKSDNEKLINFHYNQSAYKYTSPKIALKQNGQSEKNWLIYKSKTKIIKESKKELLNNISSKIKLHFKDRRLNVPQKRHLNLSKSYDNNKKTSVLKIAKAVRSKYKYLNNSNQYKKSKYKIDKRNKSSENINKKANLKEVKDIRKLFPNNLYNKVKISPYNKYKLARCRVTSKSNSELRKNEPVNKTKKKITQFQNRRVVKIGGILYKSTTTKLTLASQKVGVNSRKTISDGLKAKKNYVVYVRGEKFTLENNGRALKRQFDNAANEKSPLLTPRRIDIGGVTYLRKSNNVLIRTNIQQARHFVNKAKNKSIALLANLHKRSSMPCMIYHRFGKCNRHSEGLCMYRHDPKNIAVCKKFLKGDCADNNCLLSHQAIQEKMATCYFFLKGLCVKENCPFLHVKLSQNAAICENFLQGFCNLGRECSKRHLHQCPKYDKYGSCNLGSKCHYPHRKLKPEETSDHKRTESLCDNNVEPEDKTETVLYYTHSGIQKKRKKAKQFIAKPKGIASARKLKPAIKKNLSISSFDQNTDMIECFPKRIKLDKLPCFIPLNSGS